MMKKLTALLLTLVILMTSLPAFATESTISVEDFAKRLLDTMNETYTDPLQKAVELKMISSTDPMLKVKTKAVTKEQTAQLIYGGLRVKENVQPDLYYERLLKVYIDDLSQADKTYHRAIFTSIMKGFYEPTSTAPTDKRFLPKKLMTESDVKLLMKRFSDKALRYDPFQFGKDGITRDKIKTWENSKHIISNVLIPYVSPYKSKVPFVNGKPRPNHDEVVKSLMAGEFNNLDMYLAPYYKYYEGLNKFTKQQIEYEDYWYEVSNRFASAFYNFDYKNMDAHVKAVKATMPSDPETLALINDQKEWATKYKLSMESFFITDKSLFYRGTNYKAAKGRLYFKVTGSQKEVPYRLYINYKYIDTKIKTNTWYRVDCDIETGIFANYEDRPWSWNGDKRGVLISYQVSPVYELTPQ